VYIASVAVRVRASFGANSKWPISMEPCARSMRKKLALPPGSKVAPSRTAKKRASREALASSIQRAVEDASVKGPYARYVKRAGSSASAWVSEAVCSAADRGTSRA
jgi:phage-related baseplate assembly protein